MKNNNTDSSMHLPELQYYHEQRLRERNCALAEIIVECLPVPGSRTVYHTVSILTTTTTTQAATTAQLTLNISDVIHIFHTVTTVTTTEKMLAVSFLGLDLRSCGNIQY